MEFNDLLAILESVSVTSMPYSDATCVVGFVVSFLSFRPWSCGSRTDAYAHVASDFSGLGKFPILVLPF